ncbi:MAG: hypothetical protein U0638_08945 [Phycisphaerales bacterium]
MTRLPDPRPLAQGEHLYFLHIPKTAGTTLRTFLEDHFDADVVCPAWLTEELIDRPPSWFRRYQLLCGHYGWLALEMLDFRPRIATMLREPEDWARSAYKHVLGMKSHWLHEHCKDMSFEDFVFDEHGQVELVNLQTRFLALDDLQRDFFGHNEMAMKSPRALVDKYSQEELLAKAMARLRRIEFVGIVERFDDSLALLAHQMGWPRPRAFPKYNISPPSDRLDLGHRGRARLAALTALDRDLYVCAKELFESRFAAYDPAVADSAYAESMSGRPRIDRLDYRFDRAVHGHGWLPREKIADGVTCRWSGPTRDASMDLCLSTDRELEIRFRAGSYTRQQLQTMTLCVNGHPVPLSLRGCSNEKDMQGIFSGRLTRDVLNAGKGFARLEFAVDRAFRPCDLHPSNTDDRTIGAYFWWIEIYPSAT